MIKLNQQKAIENEGSIFKDEMKDLLRLQKQLFIEECIFFSIDECYNIWQTYSNDLAASWLHFPEKDIDILKEIKTSNFFTSFENYAK